MTTQAVKTAGQNAAYRLACGIRRSLVSKIRLATRERLRYTGGGEVNFIGAFWNYEWWLVNCHSGLIYSLKGGHCA